jgi:hypothetical protein
VPTAFAGLLTYQPPLRVGNIDGSMSSKEHTRSKTHAGNPSTSESVSILPGWIAPVVLAGLGAVAGLIALVGWQLMKPSPTVAAPPERLVAVVEQPVESPLPPAAERVNERKEQLPIEEPTSTPSIRESSPLQRRLPAGAPEPELPNEPAIVPKKPAPNESPKAVPLQAALRWTVEPPSRDAVNLIAPIEVAKIDDGTIPHRIRRLQFKDAPPQSLKLAVTPVFHDDLGSVLTRMGPGYAFSNLRKEDLVSFESLKKHDVVFLTCADMYVPDFQAAAPLRKFVAHGGTLYASDLRGDLLQVAFPEFRNRTPILPGVPQNIEASVVESGLQSFLGRKAIPLQFEAPDWRPAPFDSAKVTVCLKGTYRNNLGQSLAVPLLVKFRFQKGTVIFTSFHHAKNDAAVVQKLLDYLVFASVNARSEVRVRELMQQSQFAIHEMRPAVMNADALEGKHEHAGGTLRIALGFEHAGAKLKLTLRSPAGRAIEHADQGLYLIEVPNAAPGAWSYAVTPLDLPHPNFPLIVAVGTAKS